MSLDLSIMVGGEAGQGVASVAFLLSKMFARGGYHVFTDQDYESRIRGGHSFCRVRVSERPVRTVNEPLSILLALNKQSIALHQEEVTQGGVIVGDAEDVADASAPGVLALPLLKLAEAAGGKIMANTVVLGVAAALLDYDLAVLVAVLKKHSAAARAGRPMSRPPRLDMNTLNRTSRASLSLA